MFSGFLNFFRFFSLFSFFDILNVSLQLQPIHPAQSVMSLPIPVDMLLIFHRHILHP